MRAPVPTHSMRARQAGFSLIELMIAITIAIFVLGGISLLFLNMKRTFVAQDQLAQLQDGERLTLTVLTTSLRATGYFPSPTTTTVITAFPAWSASSGGGSMGVGQVITGSVGSGTASDSVTVRARSSGTDTLTNCLGQTVAAGAVVMTLTVNTSNELTCSLNDGNAATPLIGNVSRMTVQYGVDVSAGNDHSSFRYYTASALSAAQWMNVRMVRVTLAFVNPLAGTGQPTTLAWTQTINVMNRQ